MHAASAVMYEDKSMPTDPKFVNYVTRYMLVRYQNDDGCYLQTKTLY